MTTPDRPKYIRVTGPRDAIGVTMGQIHLVLAWNGNTPIIRNDYGYLWDLSPVDGAGSSGFPAWEPCEDPTGGGS